MELLKEITFCLLFVFICLCIAPLCLICAIRFYSLRNRTVILKRHFHIVMAVQICFIGYILVETPLATIYSLRIEPKKANTTFECLIIVSYLLSLRLGIHSVVARYYALWYDLHYSIATNKGEWIQHINSDAGRTNWFINHRTTFGSTQWMVTRVWLPVYLLCCGIFVFTYLREGFFGILEVVDNVLYIALIGVGIAIWCAIPSFYDSLSVRKEIQLQTRRLLLVCFLVYIPYSVACIFINRTADMFFTVVMVYRFAMTAGFAFAVLTNTYWVMHQSGSVNLRERKIDRSLLPSQTESRISLYNILEQHECFEEFMTHCVSEFSSENLLAVYEFTQFKLNCAHEFGIPIEFNTTVTPMIDSSVNSSIVCDDSMDWYVKAQVLIEKYILNRAALQVNVSYRCRQTLIDMYKPDKSGTRKLWTLSNDKLICVFDTTINELCSLMNDSLHRFKSTSSFAKIVQEQKLVNDNC